MSSPKNITLSWTRFEPTARLSSWSATGRAIGPAVANFPKVWSRVDRELKASLKIGRTRIQANQISATQGNPEYLWANRTQAGEHPS